MYKLQRDGWFRRSVYRSVFKKYKDEPVNDDNDLETKNNKDFFGLTPQRLKAYIKYIADRRLNLMGYKSIFNLEPFPTNPLPELEIMINAPTHTNFLKINQLIMLTYQRKVHGLKFGINHNKFSFVILMEIPLKFYSSYSFSDSSSDSLSSSLIAKSSI